MKSILIVDDELGTREYLKMILKNKYVVFLAKDAEEAFPQIEQHPPSIIILDTTLSDPDSLQVLQRIKHNNPEYICGHGHCHEDREDGYRSDEARSS